MTTPAAVPLSVREAAELLGRDRTRVYALLRSGDLVVGGTEISAAGQEIPSVWL